MTAQKLRHPQTLAGAVLEAVAAIGVDGVAHAVERSDGLVYQWSNPDAPAKPDWHQGLAIDRACIAAGHAPPLHGLATRLLAIPEGHTARPLLERLAAITAEQGDLARAITAAHRDGRISPAEQARIASQALELLRVVQDILADVSPRVAAGLRRAESAA